MYHDVKNHKQDQYQICPLHALFKYQEFSQNIDCLNLQVIIEKSYGLNGIEMNLEDLGDEFGCTKERIRQLRDKALKKLRNDSYGLLNYL